MIKGESSMGGGPVVSKTTNSPFYTRLDHIFAVFVQNPIFLRIISTPFKSWVSLSPNFAPRATNVWNPSIYCSHKKHEVWAPYDQSRRCAVNPTHSPFSLRFSAKTYYFAHFWAPLIPSNPSGWIQGRIQPEDWGGAVDTKIVKNICLKKKIGSVNGVVVVSTEGWEGEYLFCPPLDPPVAPQHLRHIRCLRSLRQPCSGLHVVLWLKAGFWVNLISHDDSSCISGHVGSWAKVTEGQPDFQSRMLYHQREVHQKSFLTIPISAYIQSFPKNDTWGQLRLYSQVTGSLKHHFLAGRCAVYDILW